MHRAGDKRARIAELEVRMYDAPVQAEHLGRRTNMGSAQLPEKVVRVAVLPTVANTYGREHGRRRCNRRGRVRK